MTVKFAAVFMLCMLQYFCPDAAMTAQECDDTAVRLVRQTRAALNEAAWLRTVIAQQKGTIKELQEDLEQLEQQVQLVTAGKLSYCVSQQYKKMESQCGKSPNSSCNIVVIVAICRCQ